MASALLRTDAHGYSLTPASPVRLTAREDSVVSLEVSMQRHEGVVAAYFEDASIEFMPPEFSGDLVIYKASPDKYFSECFGEVVLRVSVGETALIAIIDVQAKKVTADQAFRMIKYLAAHHETLVRTCFSRSTIPVGSIGEGASQPEAYLDVAERFLEQSKSSLLDFLTTRRTRLVPVREMAWSAGNSVVAFDAVDIVNGLDGLVPTFGPPDVILRRRGYRVVDLPVTTLRESSDVIENQTLLGGLYSIRSRIEHIEQELGRFVAGEVEPVGGYESLRCLILRLTSAGMLDRCARARLDCIDLIRIFEDKLGVRYKGELRPRLSPYARSSKIYRTLFTTLAEWYDLGALSFGTAHLIIKLRSLWQIYEFYCLFVFAEGLIRSGWQPQECVPDPEYGYSVPAMIAFKRNSLVLNLYYNKQITTLRRSASSGGLVDVYHQGNGEYSIWRPDFVLEFKSDSARGDKFFILDSKYSTESLVRERHLPKLVDKYYWGVACHDPLSGRLDNARIAGVAALYPKASRTFFNWRNGFADVEAMTRVLPIVFGAQLSIDEPEKFGVLANKVIEKVFESMIE